MTPTAYRAGRLPRSRRRRTHAWALVAAAALCASVVGCGTPLANTGAAAGRDPGGAGGQEVGSAEVARAVVLLAAVPVRGRAPRTGYRRTAFGSGWAVVSGCDLRNRTLSRDLVDVTYRPGTHDCVVSSGTLRDPYTGTVTAFVKGDRTSDDVQIDHRVPLLLAWQQGAQQWTEDRRRQFANDPANLVAVDASVNAAKGASGPGSWLPPNRRYWCRYIVSFVEVTARWDLSMNPGDHDASQRLLTRCG